MRNRGSLLIIVDHASNFIPPKYKNLGLPKSLTESHIAYDLNIFNLSNRINALLDSDIVYGGHSRLIIDLNRGLNDPTLIPSISDKKLIPGNIGINSREFNFRKIRFYNSYHSKIDRIINEKKIKQIISMHSFNPYFKGKKRKTEIGILSNKDRRYSDLLIKQMVKSKKYIIGDNVPYKGELKDDTLYKHGLKKNILHTLIEVRNDLINTEIKVNKISQFIVSSLRKINKELLL
ncbi:N-formylglutamate amidohydrolase [Pelagibacteraceae bacterium]|nr:N-formylglutamate amidohydrolase [Pelagibacteraceae bacterium]